MAHLPETAVVTVLRDLLSNKKISVREASVSSGIPYRTLQNQLLGKNKLSAEAFLSLADMLGAPIELFLVSDGNRKASEWQHADALLTALGVVLQRLYIAQNETPAAGGDAS